MLYFLSVNVIAIKTFYKTILNTDKCRILVLGWVEFFFKDIINVLIHIRFCIYSLFELFLFASSLTVLHKKRNPDLNNKI